MIREHHKLRVRVPSGGDYDFVRLIEYSRKAPSLLVFSRGTSPLETLEDLSLARGEMRVESYFSAEIVAPSPALCAAYERFYYDHYVREFWDLFVQESRRIHAIQGAFPPWVAGCSSCVPWVSARPDCPHCLGNGYVPASGTVAEFYERKFETLARFLGATTEVPASTHLSSARQAMDDEDLWAVTGRDKNGDQSYLWGPMKNAELLPCLLPGKVLFFYTGAQQHDTAPLNARIEEFQGARKTAIDQEIARSRNFEDRRQQERIALFLKLMENG